MLRAVTPAETKLKVRTAVAIDRRHESIVLTERERFALWLMWTAS